MRFLFVGRTVITHFTLSFSVRTAPWRQSHTVMYYVQMSNFLRYRNWRALRNEACVVLVQLGRPLPFSLLSISLPLSLSLSSLYFSPSLVFSTLSLSISSTCPCVCKFTFLSDWHIVQLIFFTDCPFHFVCCRRLLKWSRLYSC